MVTGKEQEKAWNGLISISGLETSYSYGKPFTIGSLCFDKGKLTSVIGKNGCGKTTLLRTMAGILPYKGSITIDNTECSMMNARDRAKKAAYLPQIIKPVNMDVQTLTEHGRYPWHGNHRRLSEEDKAQVETALEITGMTAYRNTDLTELSGGLLRRAYLSMAIAQNAEMILLDEPTTYMDIESQALFYDIARKLVTQGHGIVMTCHNIEQGFSYSDLIVLMGDRCIKRTGTPEELASKKDELREVFGAALKETADNDLLYRYVLTK